MGIGNSNPGLIYFVDGKLTGEQYIKILETSMIPSAKKPIGNDFIFQKDNDPKHAGDRGCKIVKKWSRKTIFIVSIGPRNHPT